MINRDRVKTLIGLLDLTSLNDSDDEVVIRQLCVDANNPVQSVAAVCVYPKFVGLAKRENASAIDGDSNSPLARDRNLNITETLPRGRGLGRGENDEHGQSSPLSLALSRELDPRAEQILCAGEGTVRATTKVLVATVANFPCGEGDHLAVIESVRASLNAGADEIDVVFPYQSYLRGEKTKAVELIRQVKAICGDDALLKVILETGALPNVQSIREIATAALHAGAQFLKTSTGKTTQGATLEAVTILLDVIRDHGGDCGIKISGGVRTPEQALDYYKLTQKILGKNWPKKETFRIGASGLLKSLLMVYDSLPLLLSE